MIYLALILLGILCLYLWRRYSRLNYLVSKLNQSIEMKKSFLLDKPFGHWQLTPIDELCRSIRQLIETDARYSEIASNSLPQLEVALEYLQEAVLIVDQSNFVLMANESARQILGNGSSLQDKRMEQILKSAEFLDYLNNLKAGHLMERREIEVNGDQKTVWFEVSGSPISGLGEEGKEMTILVLHDISRLKELEKLRKEFVANVSHELKTPLTVIKGYSETLVEDHEELPRENRERFLMKILKNVDRLNLLIEDLLTLSRLESGPHKLKRSAYHLPDLVRDLLENFQSRLDPETQTIELRADPGVDYVHIDGVRIAQTLDNLIDNALRYAGEFSKISVSLKKNEANDSIECTVADDGVGIPEKDLPHIFERFYRVDKGRSRERGGTGLGLSIVKHIILLHGGEIWAESKTGEGTAITFSLPATTPEELPSLAREAPRPLAAPEK